VSQTDRSKHLRKIPKVDEVLASDQVQQLLRIHPRAVVVVGVRRSLERLRQDILKGEGLKEPAEEAFTLPRIFPIVEEEITRQVKPHLKRIINATGVVLHTNLGRAPLSEKALNHLVTIARGYSNLEYNLAKGARGSRYEHVEEILLRLSGAEAGLVVNNNAGAVLLALNTLAEGREVIVSRGELVEIGGGFRIPEVMTRSGATLREVGTTNRTHHRDYEEAIGENTALLLKVHTSNYRVVGFTAEVTVEDLVQLGKQHNLPVMNDLGSGCFVDLSAFGLEKEPTVQDAIRSGVDVVTFSGDKLLGGPQMGAVLGKKVLIDQIKANPLNRALRIDKLTLAALETTLMSYLNEEKAVEEIPALRMLTLPPAHLRRKARRLERLLKQEVKDAQIGVIPEQSRVGGGALPLQQIPTWAVAVRPDRASIEALETELRQFDPPIIARIANDQLILDVRTLQDDELQTVGHGIKEALRRIHD